MSPPTEDNRNSRTVGPDRNKGEFVEARTRPDREEFDSPRGVIIEKLSPGTVMRGALLGWVGRKRT